MFQIDRAKVPYRIIQVPTLGIPGAVALLVSLDWYQCRDTNYSVTNFNNAVQLSDTYFLNHWGIYGVSPFTPCALFTTDAGTEINVITQTVTGWSLDLEHDTALAGDLIQVTGTLAGTINPTGSRVTLSPNSATYEVAAKHADVTTGTGETAVTTVGKPFRLNVNTYVDRLNRLHIQRDGLVAGDVLTITGTATYINPNGETETYTDTKTVTIQ